MVAALPPGDAPADRPEPKRAPQEFESPAPPDPRIPGVRRIGALASRRASLAEAELRRAQRASEAAAQALTAAEQALIDCIADVAVQRDALRAACQAEPGGSPVLTRWRQADQAQLARVPPARQAVVDRQRACDAAELALGEAADRHRALARRREKYALLEEQLRDEA
ncbi:hypothetical protein [Roseateles sp.]|uniref:hypothetical protein n=1 Tax=Roseateles sp. TaxID=1971397 RepID=UPI002F40EC69